MSLRLARRGPVQVTVSLADWPVPPAPPSAPTPVTPEPAPADGLSPFSARVLDQLSLTAWLPAALFVANLYLVLGMQLARLRPDAKPSFDNLKKAVAALNDKPVGVILAVLFGIVLVTLVTQSLEFAAIRFLEGYSGGSLLVAVPTRIGVRLQLLRLELMDHRALKLERKAFTAAAPVISEALKGEPDHASAVLLVGSNKPIRHLEANAETKQLLERAQRYYLGTEWLEHSPAHLRHRLNSLYVRRAAFPSDSSRLMPTRLGNAMRSFEEKLQGNASGSKMRGYLYERLDAVGTALMRQHTQHRNRLDMYSVMTVLTAVMAAFDLWLLPPLLPRHLVVGVTVGLVVLSYVSYRAAIAAAMDYGAILLAMDRAAAKQQPVAAPTTPRVRSS